MPCEKLLENLCKTLQPKWQMKIESMLLYTLLRDFVQYYFSNTTKMCIIIVIKLV